MWPTWTRSKAPWQRTMVRSRNWLRTRARSASGTTFWRQLSGGASAPATGRLGDTVRRSVMAAPLERAQPRQRLPHIDEILHPERLALAFLPFDQVHGHLHVGGPQPQRLHEDFRLESIPAGFDAQAFQNRGFVDLQAVVIRQPPPRDRVDEKREQLRNEGSRPRARLQHVVRVADDNISLSGVTKELPERLPSPGVVAVHHDDVRERRRLDTAPIRPAEPHVALVLQQPHGGEASRARSDERRRLVLAAIVDH